MAERFTDPQRGEPGGRHVRTPTSQLSHEEKLRRQRLHMNVLSALLVVVLLTLAYAAAFDLDSAAEWIVLGGIAITALAAIFAAQSQARG